MTAAISSSDRNGPGSLEAGAIVAGKYRIERVLGSGGMGYVVSAVHTALGQRVAIKILRTDIAHGRDEAVHRFMREARAAARIQSEHVARVVDIAELADGTPYMVMEYLEGSDLREVVAKRGPLMIAEAADYVLQACEALAEAHAAGIIHRDLKPSNLFLAKRANATEIVKVLDFGISKYVPRGAEGVAGITSTNSLMGSPLYMAPEQMKSSRDVDSRVDIWALGTILYELLAGAPPFTGSTIPEVCVAVMSAVPRPITLFRNDIPPQLQAIIVKCLSRLPADRYMNVAALARDLSRFAGVRAAVHAERASAMMRSARENQKPLSVRPDDGIPLSRDRARTDPSASRTPSQTAREEVAPAPIDVLSSSDARGESGRRRKLVLAFALGLVSFGIVGGLLMRRGPAPAAAPNVSDAPTAVTTTSTSNPMPPSTGAPAPDPSVAPNIASVPFDTLPHTPTAPTPSHAPTPKAPPVAASATVSSAPIAKPAAPDKPVPPSNTKPSDDWKWGDRN